MSGTLEIPLARFRDELPELRLVRSLRLIGTKAVVPTTLPDEIWDLSSLESLTLSNCHVTALPAGISKLQGLRGLAISDSVLTSLPDELGSLAGLERLGLKVDAIDDMPACIGRLTSLRELRLTGAKVRTLPDELASLARLQLLELNWGPRVAPAVLGRLTALRELVFIRQGTFDWESFFRIVAACPLEKLVLWTGQIEELPREIEQLTQLTKLDLSHARVRRLPRLDLPRLTELRVMHSFFAKGQSVNADVWRRTSGGPNTSLYARIS